MCDSVAEPIVTRFVEAWPQYFAHVEHSAKRSQQYLRGLADRIAEAYDQQQERKEFLRQRGPLPKGSDSRTSRKSAKKISAARQSAKVEQRLPGTRVNDDFIVDESESSDSESSSDHELLPTEFELFTGGAKSRANNFRVQRQAHNRRIPPSTTTKRVRPTSTTITPASSFHRRTCSSSSSGSSSSSSSSNSGSSSDDDDDDIDLTKLASKLVQNKQGLKGSKKTSSQGAPRQETSRSENIEAQTPVTPKPSDIVRQAAPSVGGATVDATVDSESDSDDDSEDNIPLGKLFPMPERAAKQEALKRIDQHTSLRMRKRTTAESTSRPAPPSPVALRRSPSGLQFHTTKKSKVLHVRQRRRRSPLKTRLSSKTVKDMKTRTSQFHNFLKNVKKVRPVSNSSDLNVRTAEAAQGERNQESVVKEDEIITEQQLQRHAALEARQRLVLARSTRVVEDVSDTHINHCVSDVDWSWGHASMTMFETIARKIRQMLSQVENSTQNRPHASADRMTLASTVGEMDEEVTRFIKKTASHAASVDSGTDCIVDLLNALDVQVVGPCLAGYDLLHWKLDVHAAGQTEDISRLLELFWIATSELDVVLRAALRWLQLLRPYCCAERHHENARVGPLDLFRRVVIHCTLRVSRQVMEDRFMTLLAHPSVVEHSLHLGSPIDHSSSLFRCCCFAFGLGDIVRIADDKEDLRWTVKAIRVPTDTADATVKLVETSTLEERGVQLQQCIADMSHFLAAIQRRTWTFLCQNLDAVSASDPEFILQRIDACWKFALDVLPTRATEFCCSFRLALSVSLAILLLTFEYGSAAPPTLQVDLTEFKDDVVDLATANEPTDVVTSSTFGSVHAAVVRARAAQLQWNKSQSAFPFTAPINAVASFRRLMQRVHLVLSCLCESKPHHVPRNRVKELLAVIRDGASHVFSSSSAASSTDNTGFLQRIWLKLHMLMFVCNFDGRAAKEEVCAALAALNLVVGAIGRLQLSLHTRARASQPAQLRYALWDSAVPTPLRHQISVQSIVKCAVTVAKCNPKLAAQCAADIMEAVPWDVLDGTTTTHVTAQRTHLLATLVASTVRSLFCGDKPVERSVDIAPRVATFFIETAQLFVRQSTTRWGCSLLDVGEHGCFSSLSNQALLCAIYVGLGSLVRDTESIDPKAADARQMFRALSASLSLTFEDIVALFRIAKARDSGGNLTTSATSAATDSATRQHLAQQARLDTVESRLRPVRVGLWFTRNFMGSLLELNAQHPLILAEFFSGLLEHHILLCGESGDGASAFQKKRPTRSAFVEFLTTFLEFVVSSSKRVQFHESAAVRLVRPLQGILQRICADGPTLWACDAAENASVVKLVHSLLLLVSTATRCWIDAPNISSATDSATSTTLATCAQVRQFISTISNDEEEDCELLETLDMLEGMLNRIGSSNSPTFG